MKSEVNLNLQKVIDELLPDALNTGLDVVGQIVVGESKLRTPVDSGNLRKSITHKVEGTAVYVGTNVEYAPFVHEGTRYQDAQPFLQDAVDQNMDKLVKPFENLLDKQRRG